MDERSLALKYAPILHFDSAETIPLALIGYSVLYKSGRSPSFRRDIAVPEGAMCVIEYAYYWDYDIQHMYDLEHIWVTVGGDGRVTDAEGSFHGRYLKLLVPMLPGCRPPEGTHVHADCQAGKHAFMPNGQLFRLLSDWRESCGEKAGGGVLVGNIFGGVYAPTARDDELSTRYIREHLRFEPTMDFSGEMPDTPYIMWEELRARIPLRIERELERLRSLYGEDAQ